MRSIRTTIAVNNFQSILDQRRAQINSNQPLPNLPGQALYPCTQRHDQCLQDLTDALPSKIGGTNKLECLRRTSTPTMRPLVDEYSKLFDLMDAPPVNAQNQILHSRTLSIWELLLPRARGLIAPYAEAAGRISLGLFFAETNGKQTWQCTLESLQGKFADRSIPKIKLVERGGHR